MSFPPRLASLGVGLHALTQNPLRTALSTLGIVIGSAALIAVLALGDGVERFARQQISGTTDLLTVHITPASSRLVDGIGLPRSDTVRFTPVTAADLARSVPLAGQVILTRTGPALITPQDATEPRAIMLTALWMTGDREPDSLAAGRRFRPEELEQGAPVGVVSDSLAKILGFADPAGAVGAAFELAGATITVIGVEPGRGRARFPMAYVPFAHAAPAIIPTGTVSLGRITLIAANVELVDSVRAAAVRWVEVRYDTSAVSVSPPSNRLPQVQQAIMVFKLLMGAITGISLLVGGIGIMNVLLASVVERTREIGVRRAAGARRRDILAQVLVESTTIAGFGCILGVVVGLASAYASAALIRSRSQAEVYAAFTLESFFVAAGTAMFIGLAFGCYPAFRAARLSPIDAIRHE